MTNICTILLATFLTSCATVSGVLGQAGAVRIIYYAPAWGPNTNGEEVVYFLKQVTFEAPSRGENRIYLCSIKPDGKERREITELWKESRDQWLESYATAAQMDINTATRRAAIGVDSGRKSGIFLVDLDGKNFKSLLPKEWNTDRPERASYPTWSPDGKWLAFHEHHNRHGYYGYRIVKCRDDATEYILLTDRNGSNGQPSWSPDGGWIAYTNFRGGKERGPYLHLIKPDGSEKRDTKQWGREPRWSPDGKLILLESNNLVDSSSGNRVKILKPAPRLYPNWGTSGYVYVGPGGIGFQDHDVTSDRSLLPNAAHQSVRSAHEKETERW